MSYNEPLNWQAYDNSKSDFKYILTREFKYSISITVVDQLTTYSKLQIK